MVFALPADEWLAVVPAVPVVPVLPALVLVAGVLDVLVLFVLVLLAVVLAGVFALAAASVLRAPVVAAEVCGCAGALALTPGLEACGLDDVLGPCARKGTMV